MIGITTRIHRRLANDSNNRDWLTVILIIELIMLMILSFMTHIINSQYEFNKQKKALILILELILLMILSHR